MTGAPDDPDSDSPKEDLPSTDERAGDADEREERPFDDLPSAVERVGDDDDDGVEGEDEERVVDHWPELTPAVERVAAETGGIEPATGEKSVPDEAENGEEYTVSEPERPLADDEEGEPVGEQEEFPVVPEDPETPPENEPVLGGGETAPDDEELPLAEHVEEMVFRAAIVVGVAGAISVLLYPFGDTLINVIWNQVMPGVAAATRPHLYAPLDLVITQFKVASLAGIIVAVPVLVYETYAFMRPGLYPHERRYYLAAIPTSLILAVVGVLFGFFIVLPASFAYLIGYSGVVATSALALTSTFSMVLIVMGYLALVFQLPLFMMLAIMMNLTTREWLESRRLLFWGAFVGLSFMFTSIDISGVTPIIVAVTMIALFEGTLALLRWTGS